jgi:hypothetical protein
MATLPVNTALRRDVVTPLIGLPSRGRVLEVAQSAIRASSPPRTAICPGQRPSAFRKTAFSKNQGLNLSTTASLKDSAREKHIPRSITPILFKRSVAEDKKEKTHHFLPDSLKKTGACKVSLLEILDWIPVVSTVTNSVHIFVRIFVSKNYISSSYAQYLRGTERGNHFILSRTWHTHTANLFPIVNIIVQLWRCVPHHVKHPTYL